MLRQVNNTVQISTDEKRVDAQPLKQAYMLGKCVRVGEVEPDYYKPQFTGVWYEDVQNAYPQTEKMRIFFDDEIEQLVGQVKKDSYSAPYLTEYERDNALSIFFQGKMNQLRNHYVVCRTPVIFTVDVPAECNRDSDKKISKDEILSIKGYRILKNVDIANITADVINSPRSENLMQQDFNPGKSPDEFLGNTSTSSLAYDAIKWLSSVTACLYLPLLLSQQGIGATPSDKKSISKNSSSLFSSNKQAQPSQGTAEDSLVKNPPQHGQGRNSK